MRLVFLGSPEAAVPPLRALVAAGHDVVAVSGPVQVARTIATGSSDRQANMVVFAMAALELLAEQLA